MPAGDSDDDAEPPIDRALEDPGSITAEDRTHLVDGFGTVRASEAVDALCAVVEHDPDLAGTIVEEVSPLLDADDPGVRRAAARTLAELVEVDPSAVAGAAGSLAALLDDGDAPVARTHAVRALARVAPRHPDAAAAAIPSLPAVLRAGNPQVRGHAAGIAAEAAAADPEGATSLVDPLVAVVAEPFEWSDGAVDTSAPQGLREEVREREQEAAWHHANARGRAAEALAAVGRERPDALADAMPDLIDALEGTDNPIVRDGILDALAAVAGERPALVVDAVDPLADVLATADDEAARATAAWTLGALADAEGERVADAARATIDPVIDLLDADDAGLRGAGASLLMYVAEHHPDDVAPATDALLALLDDDAAFVRGSAAWALAEVGGEAARERLDALAEDDPDEEVRAAAEGAVEAIDARLT